jgi:hypothetical protein
MADQYLGGKITELGGLQPEEKFCKDCRHYSEFEQPMPARAAGMLRSPICTVARKRDLVTGELEGVACSEMRGKRFGPSDLPFCGPEGRLWEAKQ